MTLDFIMFAFLVLPNGSYQHIGWYTDQTACRAAAKAINATLPHERGRINDRYALCRCFRCGDGYP